MNLCELISIESLKARSELIKKSAQTYIDIKQEETKKFPSEAQVQFINNNKDELPEPEKAIIHLHFWECLSIYEISEMLGMSPKVVTQIKDEAVHRLRLNYLIEFSAPKKEFCKKTKLELVS
jgi:RNA polymerase sigma factor (sigma-70 family)